MNSRCLALVSWTATQDAADENAVLLLPVPGDELSLGQAVVVRLENVMDPAGNVYEPDGVLELRFTTAEA